MFGDALSFPVRGNDWLPTTVIGGVLGVLGFLVVPGIVLQGYYIRVLRAAAAGDDHLPSFTEWGDLLVDGVKALVVALVYGLVVLVPAGVLAVVLGSIGASGRGSGVLAGALGLVGVGLVFALGLAISFVLPAALANFAVEESFGAAFDLRRIVGGALTGRYVLAWAAAMVVGLVGGFIGSALTIFLVGFFLLFHVQVVAFYLFGRGFAEGTGVYEGVSSPPGANYVESNAPSGEDPEFGSIGGLEPFGGDEDGEAGEEGDDTGSDGETGSAESDADGTDNDAGDNEADGNESADTDSDTDDTDNDADDTDNDADDADDTDDTDDATRA